MKPSTKCAHGVVELIDLIGEAAEQRLCKTDDEVEYAYIFGHVHLAAILSNVLHNNTDCVELVLDYKTAKRAYETARKGYEDLQKECEAHQISMEELFPAIFKAFDELKKNKKKKE